MLGMRALLGFGIALLLGACATTTGGTADEPSAESNLVGGKPDLRWNASGYLVRDPKAKTPACGATLIAPNVVVTAAHCVTDEAPLAFGTGNFGSGPLVRVAERHVHPDFHREAEGRVDLTFLLRKHDVAYLVLEQDVPSVTPAVFPDEAPSRGCSIQAIGYQGASGTRASTPACIMFRITLGTDPIFEVHPAESSALCVADGDEGSAVVQRDDKRTVLVGIFVGSVTQGLTDCRRGAQFLDGYESMFGYRAFLEEGIAKARTRR
jgi:hypothetical protein